MIATILLIAGVAAMFLRPLGIPMWAGPLAAAAVGVATTAIRWNETSRALSSLRDPLLFLLFAVPLAVLLDRLGLFAAVAATFDDDAKPGGGRHLVLWLWVLAAAVTIVFNLDAAVVLLTPLYIRIAERTGLSPELLAFQPALLACLASHPLPVSNLTNLIVAERFDLGVGQFARHLTLPTVVACVVGWFGYRRLAGTTSLTNRPPTDPGDAGALRRGLPIVAFVLAGFTVGDALSIPAWAIAAVAVGWAAALTRRVPWRVVPYEAMLVAAGLAVLVAGALPHLGVRSLLDASGFDGRVRAFAFGVIGSDASNNLPAVLAGSDSLRDTSQVWPLLVGVNIGPVLVLSGALSGLLWRDTAQRLGVEVSARRYSAVGVRVGLPALLAAGAVVVVLG